MPPSRHSVGTYQDKSSHATRQGTHSQSSQLAEPLWIDPGLKNRIRVHNLISTSKKKKKKLQARNEWSNILPKSLQVWKKLRDMNSLVTLPSTPAGWLWVLTLATKVGTGVRFESLVQYGIFLSVSFQCRLSYGVHIAQRATACINICVHV